MAADSTLPVWIAFAVATYVLLAVRLKAGAQPLRLRLADEGEALLKSGKLNDRGRHLVNMLLNNAFGFRAKLLLMLVAVPYVAFQQIFQSKASINSADLGVSDLDTKKKLDDLRRLHITITVANHPLLSTLVALWTAVFLVIFFVVRSIIGGLPVIDSEEFTIATADKAASIWRRMPHLTMKPY